MGLRMSNRAEQVDNRCQTAGTRCGRNDSSGNWTSGAWTTEIEILALRIATRKTAEVVGR